MHRFNRLTSVAQLLLIKHDLTVSLVTKSLSITITTYKNTTIGLFMGIISDPQQSTWDTKCSSWKRKHKFVDYQHLKLAKREVWITRNM